ncbi:metal-binding protein ZinT [Rhodobacter sp.]
MPHLFFRTLAAAVVAGLSLALPAMAETAKDASHDHSHSADEIDKGHFDDAQIAPRSLSDWEGDWQSVYPLLLDGTLDPVIAHKAEHGDKTADEYRAYYDTGYKTDVDRIEIHGDQVSFHSASGSVSGHYADDGHEVLTYEKGNRGVRYMFRKVAGDAAAPGFIQFSDHAIAPVKAGHYHLYWGDDRAAVLQELTNWPTYYPAALTGDEIMHEMQAH